MKIVYVLLEPTIGGGVRVILEFANALSEIGHDVKIVVGSGLKKQLNWFNLKVPIINVEGTLQYYLRTRSKLLNAAAWKLGYSPNFMDLIAYHIPDCDVSVATYSFVTNSVIAANRGRLFYHIQGWEPDFFSGELSNRARAALHLPLVKFVNSSWLQRKFEDEMGEKLPIICPGVDVSTFHPLNQNVSNSIGPRNKRIICLGKGVAFKGVFDLFEALNLVKKEMTNIELVLFGAEDYLAKYSPIKCTYVHLPVGDTLAKLYSSCDVFVMPSKLESFPLSPLEAMACGVPAVVTNVGVSDYAINEVNALIVEPSAPKQLAEAILRVLRDESLSDELRRNGLKTASDFSWINQSHKLEKLFMK